MRIPVLSSYPSESTVLLLFSILHVIIALLISQVGVLRRRASDSANSEVEGNVPFGAEVT